MPQVPDPGIRIVQRDVRPTFEEVRCREGAHHPTADDGDGLLHPLRADVSNLPLHDAADER